MVIAPLAASGFEQFGAEHLGLIALLLAGCVVLAVFGRRVRGSAREAGFRRGFAVIIPAFALPMQVLQLLPGDFTLGTSLPLQLCDLSWVLASYALFTRSPRASAVLYFWGLTLTTQAILTPSLGQGFPDPRYFMFWGMHLLTVWAAVFLAFGLGIGPTWRGYRLTLCCTAVWAGAVLVLNAFTGTNYGYLNRKPASSSALDLLGPWPWYVLLEIAIIAGVWALITWPWVRSRRVRGAARRCPPATRSRS